MNLTMILIMNVYINLNAFLIKFILKKKKIEI